MPEIVRFKFGLNGKKLFDRIFTKIQSKINDFSPLFKDWAEDFYNFEKQVFEAEGKVDELEAWKGLKEKYKKWKEAQFPGKKILNLTGKLEGSMTRQGATGNVTEITKDKMIVGSSVRTPDGKWSLARLHQEGTGNMPARKILRLTAKLKSTWILSARKHLEPGNL